MAKSDESRTILFTMRRIRLYFGCVLLFEFVLVLQASAQQNQPQIAGAESSGLLSAAEVQRKAESALDRIQRSDVGVGIVDATDYIEWAAHAEPARAIPVLEAFFARSQESDLRAEIASVLVSLGDEDQQYWTLILRQAQLAVSEDPPNPFESGGSADTLGICGSEEFLEWAKSHNLAPEAACEEAVTGIGDKLRPLVESGDRRGSPVLELALKSQNPITQLQAACGLVLIGDPNSVGFVIETIRDAPQDRARTLADCLIESSDPRAEAVVHQYLPDVNFAEAHQFRAQSAQWQRPILIRK